MTVRREGPKAPATQKRLPASSGGVAGHAPGRAEVEAILQDAVTRYLQWSARAAGHRPEDRRPDFNSTAVAVEELRRRLAHLLDPATGLLSALQGANDYTATRLTDLRQRVRSMDDDLLWLEECLQPLRGTGAHQKTNASAWVLIVLDCWVKRSRNEPSVEALADALAGFKDRRPPVVGARIQEATMKRWREDRARQGT